MDTPVRDVVELRCRTALAVLCAWGTLACGAGPCPPDGPPTPAARRIVSVTPFATEMLFAMGAGDRVVGVDEYGRFPPEVDRLPRVGGGYDPDSARVLALAPDLVVGGAGAPFELRQRLERAAIPCAFYDHRSLADVTATIRAIGERINLRSEADAVAARMEQDLAAVRVSVLERPRPRTLLVFGRPQGPVQNVTTISRDGFLADLLNIAGGENVFGEFCCREWIEVTTEEIVARQPEVIIDFRQSEGGPTIAGVREDFSSLVSTPAVKQNRIYLLVGDEFTVPGPRVVVLAKRLALLLHDR